MKLKLDLSGENFKLNLQLFAAEDQSRTEKPTPKKIKEAHQKGKIIKTMELPSAFLVISAGLVFLIFGLGLAEIFFMTFRSYFTSFSHLVVSSHSFGQEFFIPLKGLWQVLWPILAILLLVSLGGHLFQAKLQFSLKPLKIKWSRLSFSPGAVFKKVFISSKVTFELVKSIIKFLVIGLIVYLTIKNNFILLWQSPDVPIIVALKSVFLLALKIIFYSGLFLFFLSLLDYFYQRRRFFESLKMSKQELKEELKELEGDPVLKMRLRELRGVINNSNGN